jgi:hypothetical protein
MRESKDEFVCKSDCINLANSMLIELNKAINELRLNLNSKSEIDQQVAYCYIKCIFDFVQFKAPEMVKRTMAELYPSITTH